MPTEGRRRTVIEGVAPQIEPPHYAIKRVIGDNLTVEADVFADGHEVVEAAVLFRRQNSRTWQRERMVPLGNDRYRGTFSLPSVGWYEFSVAGWVDHFQTWRRGMQKKASATVVEEVDLEIGAALLRETKGLLPKSAGKDGSRLERIVGMLLERSDPLDSRVEVALSAELLTLMERYPDTRLESRYSQDIPLLVEPERAVFSSWYELFPRSVPGKKHTHGTFADCVAFLPRLKKMGFDVLYLPPIHPIGRTKRKGKNNSLTPSPQDPGSPWAIGAKEGGHTSIHPQLGTMEEFEHLVGRAEEAGISVALDIAFQCAPDHPWVTDHPEWFVHRPDGSIQYAENPPKKYEDIYPINFETEAWESLWTELKGVFDYWIDKGVTLFRVDNPHTKSFAFWEWCIQAIKADHPEVIFLSEAFTRPRRMYRLAKLGFTQSYTYFTWRTARDELAAYFNELYNTPVREYFRPNLWPNTPDILHDYLQAGGRPAFLIRLVLAATLSSNYGVYGPAYETIQNVPREPESEEYLNSEKYEIRDWNLDVPESIADEMARINRIRRANPALRRNHGFRTHATDNPHLFAYSKEDPASGQLILTVVNLDFSHTQSGRVEFSPAAAGRPDRRPFGVRDLLAGEDYVWTDYWNYVSLDPHSMPAHILEVHDAPK